MCLVFVAFGPRVDLVEGVVVVVVVVVCDIIWRICSRFSHASIHVFWFVIGTMVSLHVLFDDQCVVICRFICGHKQAIVYMHTLPEH